MPFMSIISDRSDGLQIGSYFLQSLHCDQFVWIEKVAVKAKKGKRRYLKISRSQRLN